MSDNPNVITSYVAQARLNAEQLKEFNALVNQGKSYEEALKIVMGNNN